MIGWKGGFVMKKKMVVLLISIMLVLSVICPDNRLEIAASEGEECVEYTDSNVKDLDYEKWTMPIYSYLTKTADNKLMVVQAGEGIDGIGVLYYDMNYQFQNELKIKQELPIFGAFYETETNYYLLTGQTNDEKKADVEVYRITKYDKSWNRISSVGLYDCNTIIPFYAGSARMAHEGKWLLIHTSHKMYSEHQANVTIQVDTDNMTITDSFTDVANVGRGYVSHSFNQFIEIENNKAVTIDHGDAYPRSIVLIKYNSDITSGKFSSNNCSSVNVMSFLGEIGDNTTCASVGGFQNSDDYYLIAGNSATQDDETSTRRTRNIFVSSVNKNTNAVSTTWITNNEEGGETSSTPHLIKITENKYMLLWYRRKVLDSVFYTMIDGTGKRIDDIYMAEGNLSDCVPVVINNKVVWYTFEQSKLTFHEIDLADMHSVNKYEKTVGHDYISYGVENGYADMRCKKCSKTKSAKVITSMKLWYNTTGKNNRYSAYFPFDSPVGTNIYCWLELNPFVNEDGYDIIIDNRDVVDVTSVSNGIFATLTVKKHGSANITFQSKLNPEVSNTVTLSLHTFDEEANPLSTNLASAATCTEPAKYYKVCTVCGEKDTKTYSYGSAKGHDYQTYTIEPKDGQDGERIVKCVTCGMVSSREVIPYKTSGLFAEYEGAEFYRDSDGNIRCRDKNGNYVINGFKCDGTYTYYFQLDGTAMRNRLTYHPDGKHVIYFDENGHEVFSNFHHVEKSIAGDAVDDLCFFDVYGYMYVDVMTYDQAGEKLYYVNPYGVIERGKWFEFSDTCVWAGTTNKVGKGYGYANADGTLLINTYTYDWLGRYVYLQGNGHMQ